MRARKGVVGAELGEDRDHDLTQEVAPLGIALHGTSASRNASIFAGGIAPVNSAAMRPSLKALTAGMPRIPKALASVCSLSTSTLTSSTAPSRASTAFSNAGVSVRQGPHQAA